MEPACAAAAVGALTAAGAAAVCALAFVWNDAKKATAKTFRKNTFLVRYVLCKFMATYNPFGAYLESKVLSASPLELVALAYEGAIEAVRNARTHLAERRIHDRSRAITKAQLLIGELQKCLDFNQGGELSTQLARLYGYMQRRLIDANFQQQEPPLREVEELLETLLESWRQLANQEKPMVEAASGSGGSSLPSWINAGEPSSTYSFTELTL
jgi:flagellar protein FliS